MNCALLLQLIDRLDTCPTINGFDESNPYIIKFLIMTTLMANPCRGRIYPTRLISFACLIKSYFTEVIPDSHYVILASHYAIPACLHALHRQAKVGIYLSFIL